MLRLHMTVSDSFFDVTARDHCHEEYELVNERICFSYSISVERKMCQVV
jgi:hypothetical protein